MCCHGSTSITRSNVIAFGLELEACVAHRHLVLFADRHPLAFLAELDQHQPSVGLQRAFDRSQEHLRLRQLVVDVHHQREIDRRRPAASIPSACPAPARRCRRSSCRPAACGEARASRAGCRWRTRGRSARPHQQDERCSSRIRRRCRRRSGRDRSSAPRSPLRALPRAPARAGRATPPHQRPSPTQSVVRTPGAYLAREGRRSRPMFLRRGSGRAGQNGRGCSSLTRPIDGSADEPWGRALS